MSQMGSNPVVPVMSAARPLFPRKRKSIHDVAMSRKCHNRAHAPQQIARFQGPHLQTDSAVGMQVARFTLSVDQHAA